MTKWGILRVSLCWVKYSESIFKPIVISASQGANQVTWGSKYIKPHSHHMYTTSKAGGWTPGPQTNRGPAALMLSGFLSGFLLTSKVVFVWFDRGMLEFQSKIACQCPHWLPRWQWDTVQQTTADHRGASCQPAMVQSLPNSRQSNTGDTCSAPLSSQRGHRGWR